MAGDCGKFPAFEFEKTDHSGNSTGFDLTPDLKAGILAPFALISMFTNRRKSNAIII